MIVFDLACSGGHRFESWFRDGAAFEEQSAGGAISCPYCGDSHVVKAPTRLHVAHAGGGEGRETPATETAPAEVAETLRKLRRLISERCDYVGREFPEEARRIHYGEASARSIYGEASAEDAKALREEGIEVQPLPWMPRRDD
jgi:hypothetical protein